MPETGTGTAGATTGAAPGYRATRTLGLRVELARQIRRKRTIGTFLFLAALPLLLIGAFALGGPPPEGPANLADVATSGALNFTLFVLFATTGFFLVVVYALFFGDTVASEAGWGSLRYLLAAPVPRARLLRQKFLVALILSVCALVLLVAVALAAGAVAYGWNPVRTPTGLSLTPGQMLPRLLAIVAYIGGTLVAVGAVAFCLSVLTDAPLAAVGGAVLLIIVAAILQAIDALGSIRDFLPTQNQFAWVGMLSDPPETADMFTGCLQALAYVVVLTALAFWRFGRKDITS